MKTIEITDASNLRLKNRLREHGSQWDILQADTPLCLNGRPGILAMSVKTGHCRWMALEDITYSPISEV